MGRKILNKIIFVLFIIYCVVLGFVLFYPGLHHPSAFVRSYNLVPFATICEMFTRLANQTINTDIVINNIAVNIAMFIPMGMALPVLFRRTRKLWKVILISFLVTFFAETIQYILNLGSFDIDDIILNVLGGALGYGLVSIPVIRKLFIGT